MQRKAENPHVKEAGTRECFELKIIIHLLIECIVYSFITNINLIHRLAALVPSSDFANISVNAVLRLLFLLSSNRVNKVHTCSCVLSLLRIKGVFPCLGAINYIRFGYKVAAGM